MLPRALTGFVAAPLLTLTAVLLAAPGCERASGPERRKAAAPASAVVTTASKADPAAVPPAERVKVDVQEQAMGTKLHFIAYSSDTLDEADTRAAIAGAVQEIRRLEAMLSEWQHDSEVGRINQRPGEWLEVGPETFEVLEHAVRAGKLSDGAFDITFQTLSSLWKFGSAQESAPRAPSRAEVEKLRPHVDYRKIELDSAGRRVRIGSQQQIGLGGIAKGYILDRSVAKLRAAGVHDFLARAGGDLYGSGKKPDGSPWVSGVQDPRAPQGEFFASIELEDRAFSTAGDYARSFVAGGKRYHHILDPKTGFPATACRSVTIWAEDALTADVIDDAVFVLGPERGLPLVEATPGAGALIVDAENRVHVSERLKGRVKVLRAPTDGI